MNRSSASFGATDQRVYVTNSKVPVHDSTISNQIAEIIPILIDISNNSSGGGGITGQVSVSNFPATQVVTVSGPIGITGLVGVTGNFQSGPITISANQFVGITGGITGQVSVSNFPATQVVTVSGPIGITGLVGVTGNFQSGPITISANQFVGITGGITGEVSISNFPTTQVVTVSGPIGITGLVGVTGNFQSGPITISGNQFVGITGGITGEVSISNFPTTQVVTVSGPVGITGLVGVTGNFQNGPITISGNQFVGITGGITGNVGLSNWVLDASGYQVPLDVNVISTVSVFGDVNVISSVPIDVGSIIPIEISPNQYVGVTGIVGITGAVSVLNPVQVLGDDYSGGTNTQFPIYVDVDGVQRVETVPVHIETAKYIFETDVSYVALTGAADIKLDVRGREGWYVDTAAGVQLEWYDNSVSDPPSIAFNKMQAVFAVAYNDISGAAPKIFVSTGSSVWSYETTATLYPGETYVYYYGQKAVVLNPGYHPVLLTRTLFSGTGNLTDPITSIYVSFAAGSKAGIISAGIWNQDLQLQFRTTFSNNRDLTVRNNLCKLGFTGPAGNNLQTSIAQIASGTVIGITGPVGITGILNSKITDGTLTAAVQGITGSNLNTSALNVNVTNAFRPLGSRGNIIAAGTIAAWAYNAASAVSLLDASGSRIYGKDTYISYEDTSPAVTSNISIWGYDSTGGYHPIIANATPVTGYNTSGVASYRYFTSMANLSFFTGIRVKNDGATGISGVYLSLLTANAGSL